MLTKRDYEHAMFVQSAVNLSGVVLSFAEILPRIWEEAKAKDQGTDYVNRHPISRLFAETIISLAGGYSDKSYLDAYEAVEKAIKHWEEPRAEPPYRR